MYTQQVINYSRDITYLGCLDATLPNVASGITVSSCCGTVEFYIQADNNEKITNIRYQIQSNLIAMACAAYLARQCLGLSLMQAFQLSESQAANVLNLTFKDVRKANLVYKALRQTIANCHTKIRRYYNESF
jgi:NifU-like protein involved in Fe-S cluster formation